MRHYTLILTICTLVIAACTGEKKEIERVAYEYSMAMANYRFDDATPFATEETAITTIHTANILIRNIDSSYIESDMPANIEITRVDILDDTTADVTYRKTTPIKDFSGTLQMRKRNGQWLAHVIPQRRAEQPSQQQFEITDSILIDGKYHPLFSRVNAL